MAVLQIPFIDMEVIEEAVGEGAEEKKKAAEDVFLQELVTAHIDKYGQFYVQYLKFKEIITVDPLMPDQKALRELADLQKEETTY